MKSIKVLISAYACRPNQGSEPGVGWNVSRELAKHHQVWIVTREDNRPTIEAELAKNPIPRLHVVYYDLPAWGRWWYRRQHWGVQFHYYLWQIGAYFVARRLHQEVGFDLIHHVTYVKYWSPSFLSLLPVPFIWGPVGGGESAPKAFWRDFSWRGKAYETLRDVARGLGENDPFVRMTIQHSAIAQSTTEDTAKRLHKIGATNVQILSETALASEEISRLAQHALPNDDSSIKFISMGRLLHWKGFHLGIRAFAQADLPEDAEYWLLGNGPERQRLQVLAESLGIADRVKFWDRLPREETLQKLSECVALVHPSLHDSGGWVCLEAMATGRPVLCLDLGGPAVQVTSETGFKVAADTPEQAVRDLAKAMTLLAQDSSLCMRMGQAGKKRVSEAYSWEAKGRSLNQLYAEILALQ